MTQLGCKGNRKRGIHTPGISQTSSLHAEPRPRCGLPAGFACLDTTSSYASKPSLKIIHAQRLLFLRWIRRKLALVLWMTTAYTGEDTIKTLHSPCQLFPGKRRNSLLITNLAIGLTQAQKQETLMRSWDFYFSPVKKAIYWSNSLNLCQKVLILTQGWLQCLTGSSMTMSEFLVQVLWKVNAEGKWQVA